MKTAIKKHAIFLTLLITLLSAYKCNTPNEESPERYKLLLKSSEKISIPEPSGLALSYDKNYLWSVSDQNSTVYLMTKSGKVLKYFTVQSEDLEGITVIDSLRIAVIAERTREVVVLDTSGNELSRNKFALKGRLNEGLEGICYHKGLCKFFIVNEKRPGLFITTDSTFNIISSEEIMFAKDYSGLAYDDFDNSLWILSDESKRFYKVNEKGNVLREFKIFIEQPEGIAVDGKNKKVFIVSDKTERLYEYDLP